MVVSPHYGAAVCHEDSTTYVDLDMFSIIFVVQQLRNVVLNVFSFSTRVDNIWLVLWFGVA